MNATRFTASAALALASLGLAACASSDADKRYGAGAVAQLQATGAVQPASAGGRISFTPLAEGVRVKGEVTGLPPGEHGFHVHEKGDCGDQGNAAGGHFNPAGGPHGKFGSAPHHAGDLPSLTANSSGVAQVDATVPGISLLDGASESVLGRALVVHRDRDDGSSQPAGNAGPRIACAVIKRG